MISQVMNNSALCAKVQAMLGKALTEDDYDAVMNMKSVPDFSLSLSEYIILSQNPKSYADFAFIHVSESIIFDIFALDNPVLF